MDIKVVSLMQMKSLVVIFAVLIVGITFIVIWDQSSKPEIDQINYNEISWRVPSNIEVNKLGESFLNSEIEGCSNYFIKKFEGEKYLIACYSGEGSWVYYTAYPGQTKIYLTPREFTISLIPPESLPQQPVKDPLRIESTESENTGFSRNTMEAK